MIKCETGEGDDLRLVKLSKKINPNINKISISKGFYKINHFGLKIPMYIPKLICLDDRIFKYNKKQKNRFGSLGLVVKYTNVDNDKDNRAIKVMSVKKLESIKINNYENFVKNELIFYSNLSEFKKYPKCIIPSDCCFCYKIDNIQFSFLVMKWIDNTLDYYIPKFNSIEKYTIINKLCELLYEFKSLGFVHNDFKTLNIMCDWNDILKEYQLYLIDFNCYNKNNGDNLCGGHSFAYASPQVILSKNDDCYGLFSNDIWCLGIIIFNVLNGLNSEKFLKPVKKELLEFNLYSVLINFICSKGESHIDLVKCQKIATKLPSKYLDIIERCFIYDSKSRITIENIVDILGLKRI